VPETVIHVARDEAPLGTFAPDEVLELLDTGFLKPGDASWMRGMKEWRPLNETMSRVPPAGHPPDWRDSVVAGSTALSRLIGRGMGKFVANVKVQAGGGPGVLTRARKMALEQYLPQFNKLVTETLREKPADFAREALRNDDTMRKFSGGLYQCLPRSLRRFVAEEAFVGFCLEHRQKLVVPSGLTGSPPTAPVPPAGPAPHQPPA